MIPLVGVSDSGTTYLSVGTCVFREYRKSHSYRRTSMVTESLSGVPVNQ